MNKVILPFALFCAVAVSCSKEQESVRSEETSTVSSDEIAVLQEEVKLLKEETATLRNETEELRKQIAELYSEDKIENEIVEVDGLLFDRNGDVVSLVKKASLVDFGKGTTTRTFDDKGRLVQTYTDYKEKTQLSGNPFYWRKTIYSYSGKTVTTTVQTNKYGLPAGQRYEETVSVESYW